MDLDEINASIEALKVGERLILQDVDERDYHASRGIGSTTMKAGTKSMAHFKIAVEGEREFSAQTLKAMSVGSALHCLVLEPEKYTEKFIVQPEDIKVRRGKAWDAFESENREKDILTLDDENTAKGMAAAINNEVGEYFKGGINEYSFWYRYKPNIVLKARIDCAVDDLIIDLKTTYVDEPYQFTKTVKYDYNIQDAHYRLVTGFKDMLFIGVSKSKPHDIFLVKQGDDVKERAERLLHTTINSIEMALDFDEFPKRPIEINETELTAWERDNAA